MVLGLQVSPSRFIFLLDIRHISSATVRYVTGDPCAQNEERGPWELPYKGGMRAACGMGRAARRRIALLAGDRPVIWRVWVGGCRGEPRGAGAGREGGMRYAG